MINYKVLLPIIKVIDGFFFHPLMKKLYSKYNFQNENKLAFRLLLKYAFLQKLIGFNRFVPWPVHFTSTVLGWKNIISEGDCAPGDSASNYIQAYNGIEFGAFVELGPGVKIISADHDPNDITKHIKCDPIKIGSHVWVGANSVILPEVCIGNNVVIGAGSVVTKNIPSNTIAVGNPCKVIKDKNEKS